MQTQEQKLAAAREYADALLARKAACLVPNQAVQCQSCGATWVQTDICYSCRGTVFPLIIG